METCLLSWLCSLFSLKRKTQTKTKTQSGSRRHARQAAVGPENNTSSCSGKFQLRRAPALPGLTKPTSQNPVRLLRGAAGAPAQGLCTGCGLTSSTAPLAVLPTASLPGAAPRPTLRLPAARLCDSGGLILFPGLAPLRLWLGHGSVALLWVSRASHVCDKCPVSACWMKAFMD